MRWKLNGEDNDMYKCCFCCHVRTGTIFLGLFILMAHILALSAYALVILHPELAQKEAGIQVIPGGGGDQLDTSSMETIHINSAFQDGQQWTGEDKFVLLLMIMGSFFVTVLLVYGAAKGHASYLMPFFCVQVFDFCVTCLSAVSYFSYMPDIKQRIIAQDWLPYKERLMGMDGDFVMLLVVIVFVLILSIKAYFIGIVWACYKYLTSGGRTATTLNRNYEGSNGEDSEMLLPPKYEDAIRMTPEEANPPPPPYSDAAASNNA